MRSFVVGKTESGIPIFAHSFGDLKLDVLILGGVHGDEYEGIALAFSLLEKLEDLGLNITVIPVLNCDGMLLRTRWNINKVDLNRNLPTKDWSPNFEKAKYNPGDQPNSQSENKALTGFIDKYEPSFILTLHSYKPMLNINGDCKKFALALQKRIGYEINDYIGYPTPGSLGTYGTSRNIPVLTYEIERGLSIEKILQTHLPATLSALREIYGRTN